MIETAVVIPDIHCDRQDAKFINIATQLIRKLRPKYVIQLGDAMDLSTISTYLTSADSTDCIMKDIAAYNKILDQWQAAMPDGCVFHQLEGNHCARAQKFLARNCRQMHKLFKPISEMLKLKERSKSGKKFIWHPYDKWDSCKIYDVIFHHGTYFDKNLAVSNLTRYQCIKFVQGHSHRYQHAAANGFWSVSLGHGSEASKTAHIAAPNTWQQSLGVITFVDRRGHFEPLIVHNGMGVFRGEVYKG
jgi:hypothetical protein